MKKIILSFFIVFSILPSFVLAQEGEGLPIKEEVKLDYSGLVKCDGVVAKDRNQISGIEMGAAKGEELRQTKCDFAALLQTVKTSINWLFAIAVPLMIVFIAYGGLLYMTGSQKNIGIAKGIFLSAGKGFIIMLVAWVAVITVVNWFISDANKAVINTFVNLPK